MATTAPDLAEAFRRLVAALAWLDGQPDGIVRAQVIRRRFINDMANTCDLLAGKGVKCELHPSMLGHNCPCCRSERIGREPDDPIAFPATPAGVAEVEARMLGERDTTPETPPEPEGVRCNT